MRRFLDGTDGRALLEPAQVRHAWAETYFHRALLAVAIAPVALLDYVRSLAQEPGYLPAWKGLATLPLPDAWRATLPPMARPARLDRPEPPRDPCQRRRIDGRRDCQRSDIDERIALVLYLNELTADVIGGEVGRVAELCLGTGQHASADLLARIEGGTARVGIIGLGYVGLPLARAFADARLSPSSASTSTRPRSRGSSAGESYIGHIPDAVDPPDARAAASRRPTDFERLDEPDAIIICVPTPLTEAREPDLTYIVNSAAGDRRRGCGPASSSSWRAPPTRARPATSSCRSSRQAGLKAGRGLLPGLQPRARGPGQPAASRRPTIPKVVGGLDPASLELAAALYGKVVVRVVPVSSPEVAEACKILENTYRAVNIALVNELKILYDRMGIDVWEVIEAAKTKPFGFQAFYPGPRPGRALHPDRPVLPDLGGPQARPDDPLHRAGRRDQHVDARLRRQQGRRRPQRPTASRSRGARSCSWAWPTRRTWTTPASRPASS